MTLDRSWRLGRSENGALDRLYDWLRRGVNRRLVRYLSQRCIAPAAGRAGPAAVRVLEAGSGTAYASSLFARRPGVGTCVCVDLDEAALRAARRRDPMLPVVAADLMKLPFRDESFALVFNSSTVEHLHEPRPAVDEMQRVCRGDGHVFVGVPYRFGPLGFQPVIRSTRLGHWLGPVFSRRSLNALLRSARLHPVGHLRYFWRFFIGAVAARTGPASPEAAS